MKKLFTINQTQNGEMAVRGMSKKAQEWYNGCDPLRVIEYDGEDRKLYCIEDCDGQRLGLTFEQVQAEFEAMQAEVDAMSEDDDEE